MQRILQAVLSSTAMEHGKPMDADVYVLLHYVVHNFQMKVQTEAVRRARLEHCSVVTRRHVRRAIADMFPTPQGQF